MFEITQESFEEPKTWLAENKEEYVEVLMDWIFSDDHFYDLYRYFADCKRNGEAHKHTLKLQKLYHKFLNEIDGIDEDDEDGKYSYVEFFDGFYQKEIAEFESWKEEYERSKESEQNPKILKFKKKS